MNRIVIALLKPFSFIPAILMMSLIFSFSSQNGTESSQLSEKVARGIFITIDHVMDRGWDDEKIQELADEYQYPVRKLAHMTEYCLQSVFRFRSTSTACAASRSRFLPASSVSPLPRAMSSTRRRSPTAARR